MKKTLKKITSLLSSAVMIAGLAGAGTVFTAVPVLADDNTVAISTVADWQTFAARVNGGDTMEGIKVTLENDLAISDAEMVSAGNFNSLSFQGEFDGQGHTVTMGDADAPATKVLFGWVGSNGSVSDLTTAGYVTVSAKTYAGGVAAVNSGVIERCTNNAQVTDTYSGVPYAGGIVGYDQGMIRDCVNNGTVITSGNGQPYSGGIAGYIVSGTVTGCANKGDVKADTLNTRSSAFAGGITGGCSMSASSASGVEISCCYNRGSITAARGYANTQTNVCACGIAGYTSYLGSTAEKTYLIKNCYSTGKLSAGSYNDEQTAVVAEKTVYGITYNATGAAYADYCIFNNLYFLSGTATNALAATTNCTVTEVSSKTQAQMQGEAFITLLSAGLENSRWAADTENINDGYPVIVVTEPEPAADAIEAVSFGGNYYLVKYTPGEAVAEGKTVMYGEQEMFIADDGCWYCVITDDVTPSVDSVSIAVGTQTAYTAVSKGDINGNGSINIVDAQIAYDIANSVYSGFDKLSAFEIFKADANNDRAVNALDARAIQYYVHNGAFAD